MQFGSRERIINTVRNKENKETNGKKFEVKIRPLSETDFPEIITLEKSISSKQNLLSMTDLYSTKNQINYNFVAEVDGNIVGGIIAQLTYLMIPVTETCVIHGLLVHPDFRKRGIGRKLVDTLLDNCRIEGIYTIRAQVPVQDSELLRFVVRIGFRSSNIINMDMTFEA